MKMIFYKFMNDQDIGFRQKLIVIVPAAVGAIALKLFIFYFVDPITRFLSFGYQKAANKLLNEEIDVAFFVSTHR